MFKKKILLTLAATVISITMSASAFAAALQVKADNIKDSGVEVSFPQISGAQGGSAVDKKVNMQIIGNVWNGLMGAISTTPLNPVADEASFAQTFGTVDEAKSSTKAIGSYLSRRLKLDREKAGQNTPYFVHMNYDMKSTPQKGSSLLSIIQQVDVYTGGAHTNTHYVPVNYDLKTGKPLALGDLFKKGSNYKEELRKNIEFSTYSQQRLWMHQNNADEAPAFPQPEAITGDEKFYVMDQRLFIIYNPGEIAPFSDGTKTFVIPFDAPEIANIITLGK